MLWQRYFWLSWYGMGETISMLVDNWFFAYVARAAYMAAFLSAEILLLLLAIAYHFEGSPYSANSYLLLVLYLAYLTGVAYMLMEDLSLRVDVEGLGAFAGSLTLMQAGVVLSTALANVAMTWVTVSDLNRV